MTDTTSATGTWHLDGEALRDLAALRCEAYRSADPFPHTVIDDFLPQAVLRELVDAFPGPDDGSWYRFDRAAEVKLALADETAMPEAHLRVLRELNGSVFVDFLERLTGIEGLVPDPGLVGGGLHQIAAGGLLKVHADFNLHNRTGLQRRLNALLYLNEDWDEAFGGLLELWDRDMTRAVRRIAPVANRLVIFSTTSTSYHGHPDPLTPPAGRTRRSMAWYYYSKPERAPARHTTLFQERPDERFLPSSARVLASLPTPVQRGLRRAAGGARRLRHLAG